MKLKKLISTLIGTCLVLAGAAAAAQPLKLSHIRPQGAVADNDINAFIENVQEITEGLDFDVYPANALGDYTDVQERVSMGIVDMALQPISSAADRKLQIGLMPYLATDWESAANTFGVDSGLRKEVEELYGRQGIKVLAVYPVYFGGIALNKEPYDSDGEQRNLKLRVPPFKIFSLLAESLDFIPAPIPFAEAFTAVQTGVVDGVIGAGAEGYYDSFRDVTEYYLPMNTHFEAWYLLMNEDRFEALSEEQKNALLEAAQAFETNRWEVVESEQSRNEQRLVDAGATLIEVSDDQLLEAATKVREQVWPEILKDIGEDWATPILEPLMNN